VKNANPSMSVCEVGASIGRLWREMSDADKQQYNEDFSREKVDSTVCRRNIQAISQDLHCMAHLFLLLCVSVRKPETFVTSTSFSRACFFFVLVLV